MNIETKTNIGSKVYFLRAIKKETCPVCSGTGKIVLGRSIDFNAGSTDEFIEQVGEQIAQNIVDIANGNVKSYTCPECGGKKQVKATGQTKYKVCEGTVVGIHACVDQFRAFSMYEMTNEHGAIIKKREDTIWTDRDEADKRCAFLNLERRMLPIECIQIPSFFATSIPHNSKLMKRSDEWRSKKQFDTEIYVSEKNGKYELFDGYTVYLVYKMLGFIDIPVVIWPSES